MNPKEPEHSDGALRILYIAPHQIWPTNTGSRLRDYQLAQQLALCSSVTFMEMRQAAEEQHAVPDDSRIARIVTLNKSRTYSPTKIFRGLIGPIPITVLNCWSSRAASQLADVLRSYQFDTVQVEGVLLIEYLPIIREAQGCPAVIVDWHNIESEMMWRYAKTTGNWLKRIAARRTAKLIERAEDLLLDNHVTHTVTSERERQKLLARRPGANIHVIPNGVDTSYYTARTISEVTRPRGQADSKPTILFVGSMDYHANVDAVSWFSRVSWPQIALNHPDMQFMIVGRNPRPEVRALASDRIHVTGTVDDVRPFYAPAVAVVVPLRSGSGTRVKILEAMAAGVPVVSTRLGAEGLEVEDGAHLLLADSGQEITSAVNRVASSTELQVRLSQAGRALVCRVYDWTIIGEKLYGIHDRLSQSRPPTSARKVS
jgi:glycosyltransferase involved in cell wall biosynthesis